MKKLSVFSLVVGLILAGGGMASVLAQTTYELYAVAKSSYTAASNFQLRYIDLDGDGKFSLNELIRFSMVKWDGKTYTQILGVPSDPADSPFTDGPCWSGNSSLCSWWWWFDDPSPGTGIYIRSNEWTYSQTPVSTVAVPGKTVVKDYMDDLQFRNCDPNYPDIPCSLPPGAPASLPGYFDIKSAQITQVGTGQVDLSIQLYEPIPAQPPYLYMSYAWQFAGGCVPPVEVGDKAAIAVLWNSPARPQQWTAVWSVIEQCIPERVINVDYANPLPLTFTADGVKVRVPLADLLTAADGTGTLTWHAAVRRVPVIYYTDENKTVQYISTAVDYAPDVVEFNPTPPPYVISPEDFATWRPR